MTASEAHHGPCVQSAAYDHLAARLEDGTPPPSAPALEVDPDDPNGIARDELGHALGGIRLPHVEVPIALNAGFNSGPGLCRFRGATIPFDDETLDELYRNHGSYVRAIQQSVRENVDAGYLLQPDATTIRTDAPRSDIGRR